PPTRLANAATARSAPPPRTASTSAFNASALAARSPSQRRITASGACAASGSRRCAASFAAPPLPMLRSERTTSAPWAAATAALSSPEPSSATTMRASGNAAARAPRVAGRRSASLWAVTITAVAETIGSGGYSGDPRARLRRPHPVPSDSRRSSVPDVEAHITGTVWRVEVAIGDAVDEGDTVVILESMKMEMPVEAEDPGVVKEIRCEEGQAVSEGDTLVVLE